MNVSIVPVPSSARQRGCVWALACIPLAFAVISACVLSHPHSRLACFFHGRISHDALVALGAVSLVSSLALMILAESIRDKTPAPYQLPFQPTRVELKEDASTSTPRREVCVRRFHLPELNAEIFDHLDIQSLGRLSKVSRACNELAQRALRRRARSLGYKGPMEGAIPYMREKVLDIRYLAEHELIPVIWHTWSVIDHKKTKRAQGPLCLRASNELAQSALKRRARSFGYQGPEEKMIPYLREQVKDIRYLAEQGLIPVVWHSWCTINYQETVRAQGPLGNEVGILLQTELRAGNIGAVSALLRTGRVSFAKAWSIALFWHDDPKLCEVLQAHVGAASMSLSWQELVSGLQVAAYHERKKSIDFLLQFPEQRNFTNSRGSALHEAPSWVVPLLLEGGVDPNLTNSQGETALHARLDSPRIVKRLIPKANLNARAPGGKTALYNAIKGRHYKTAELLVDAGADVDLVTQNGDSPLFALLDRTLESLIFPWDEFTWERLIAKIVARSNRLDFLNGEGLTPLGKAARRGHDFAVNLLVEWRVNLDLAGLGNFTPLHMAIRQQQWRYAKLLLKAGANPDIVSADPDRQTAFSESAQYAPSRLFLALLEKTNKVDHQDALGQTALHIAVLQGHKKHIRALLAKGADPDKIANNGNTPRNLAQSKSHLASLFQES